MVSTRVESKVNLLEKEVTDKFNGLAIEMGAIREELKGIQIELKEARSMRKDVTEIKEILAVVCQKEIKGKAIADQLKVQEDSGNSRSNKLSDEEKSDSRKKH